MEEMVREHEFVDDVCRWCGGRASKLANSLTCISRQGEAAHRSIPTSIFSDLGSIGDRMREIQAEELPAPETNPKSQPQSGDQRKFAGHNHEPLKN